MDTSVKKVYKTVDLDYHHLIMMSSDGIAFELVYQDKTYNHEGSDHFLVWTYPQSMLHS
jgi:phosphoribosyl-ATP pyrophosphohydrolase